MKFVHAADIHLDSPLQALALQEAAEIQRLRGAKSGPSGHDIAAAFGRRNEGAIPPNLLQIPNTDSNSHYLRMCKALGRESHPARFPADLPRFFVQFLTDPGDIVLDIFSGSNTTGHVAEECERRWLSVDIDRGYASLSAIRFMEGLDEESIRMAVDRMAAGEFVTVKPYSPTNETSATDEVPVKTTPRQSLLFHK